MKQKLGIAILLVVVVGVLAALSAATYVQKQRSPDSESEPNRSTFNAGPTGTQAYFTLLDESGRKAARWQQPPAALLTARPSERPKVFVVIGTTRRAFTKQEADALLQWVSAGGRLVLIDRNPDERLLKTSALWKLTALTDENFDIYSVDPSDPAQMTLNTPAAKQVQPSLLTWRVNAVQTSRFAGKISFERIMPGKNAEPTPLVGNVPTQDEHTSSGDVPAPAERAPAAPLVTEGRNILIEAPYGEGKIVVLSDPFIVSNAGIGLVDNSTLGIDLVAVEDGLVAFDEYHQGYGTDDNRFLEFFAGTPIVALFFQGLLILGCVFYSQSRRFARAIPEVEADRLSKLEYIAAMAELQQRTHAYDLAIENIYTEFRRRMTRAFGLEPAGASSSDLAAAIAAASRSNGSAVAATLSQCEEIIRGEPTNKREVLRLISELRALETATGVRRAAAKPL